LRVGEIVGGHVGPRLRDDEHDVYPARGRVRLREALGFAGRDVYRDGRGRRAQRARACSQR
jgi:hypothetical protein